jgi:hypothetical protein
MIHLEPDLGYLQRIHEAALVAAGSFDVPLYITTQACEFLAVLFLCSLHGLGDLIDQTAHVLFHGAPCYGEEGVSSVHQRIPKPSYLGYSVSKGGVANLTTTLALEYARQGIRVNGIRRLPRALVVGMIGAGGRWLPSPWTYLPRSLALRSIQNSLPSGSASTTHPVPSG